MQLSLECELIFWSCTAGIAAADVDGEQLEPALVDRRIGLLILGDDHDRRRGHHHARVLVGRRADAPRDHQADMPAVAHGVGVERLVQPLRQLVAAEADVHCDGLRAFEQPVEVAIEKGELAATDAQALPTRRRRA